MKQHLYRFLNTPGDPQFSRAWRLLAWLRHRIRVSFHRLFRRQSPILLALDEPVRLSGFGSITGWAISRGSAITQIEARVDGRTLAAGPPAEHRSDVVQRFPYFRSAGPNAFRLAPSVDTLRNGRYRLALRAIDAHSRTTELFTTLEVRDYRIADTGELPAHLHGTNREYQYWLSAMEDYGEPGALATGGFRLFPRRPSVTCASGSPENRARISVVMPVYRSRLDHLRAAIDSLRSQIYQNWELCICDDGSRQAELTRFLQTMCAADSRIRCTSHLTNCGISAATNSAIASATGEFIAFLDQDDLLAPEALAKIASALADQPADLLYTDEDRLDEHGCRIEPIFKPDWSPDLLMSRMYLGHLCVYRRAFLQRVGLCRSAFDGTQDYDLALRAAERTTRIVHIAKVLYHWRLGGNSAGPQFNRHCHLRGCQALAERLERQKIPARVVDGPSSCTFQVRYCHSRQPLVSILIPTRDNLGLLRRCLRSIRRRTRYPHYEILILDNGSRDPATLRFLKKCGARVIRFRIPFNHSRLNNLAAGQAHGDLLLLLNDDTEVITRDWMSAMVEQAMRSEVGAVGAWLFHPDGRTQHAGVVLGLGPVATPLHSGILRDGLDRGTVGLIRNVSAVTGACLMVHRQLYLNLGGLDEDALPTSFNDVDLCLRLRKAGYGIVQTPLARLYHHESASRVIGNEDRYVQVMQNRWGDALKRDPFWNPNLPHGPEADPAMAFHWTPEMLGSLTTTAPFIEFQKPPLAA